MTRITIEEDGRATVVTDIVPYCVERDQIVAKLTAIYDGFEKGPVGALAAREPEIVELINRHVVLERVIDAFEQEGIRRVNILAGWEIVKQHRSGEA